VQYIDIVYLHIRVKIIKNHQTHKKTWYLLIIQPYKSILIQYNMDNIYLYIMRETLF